MKNEKLKTVLAAKYCGVSPSYLAKLRLTGKGPKFIRIGRKAVIYDPNDLDEWLDSLKFFSTSEY
mgnify:CR=1 FL=1